MAKTYTAPGSATAGDVYTATAHNVIVTDVSNLIVPPTAMVRRTTNQTSYTSGTAITWSSSSYDTDSMWAAGSPTILTVQTTGVYLITFTLAFNATATLTRCIGKVLKNGSWLAGFDSAVTSTASYGGVSVIASLTATDTISAAVDLTGGSAYVINGSATEDNTQSRLAMMWIGRTA